MKQLPFILKSLHFQCLKLILSGQVFNVLLTNAHSITFNQICFLHSFRRHKLTLLSYCSVFKVRQYRKKRTTFDCNGMFAERLCVIDL